MIRLTLLLGTLPLLMCNNSALGAEWKLAQMVGKDRKGATIYHPWPVPKQSRNVWPEEYEREFQTRARKIIDAQSNRRARGTTYFENEKRYYGYLMAQVIGKQGLKAMKPLQAEDAQAKEWHRHTEGIDYYACFTLKHQMRKYFYFGDLLEPAYRKRMYQGARAWTEKDPLRRPHHAYKGRKAGWGPDAKNSWVDVRNTENLFLMRVTSVYLMAEETRNKATQQKYKQIILNYAKSLYRIGMGEWDSENYHGHSIGPLCNLYDFAKDPEAKLAAKACLDWICAAGAAKYYRGGFNGPGSRDYNHAQPFGGSAASMLWVYFGDTPKFPSHWESDEVHLITSAYRPPVAVMKLARKEFDRPVELFSSKPRYNATTTFDLKSEPAYLETQYFGHTFQLGTLSCGTPPGVSAVNGFKILVADRKEGCRILHAVPGPDPVFAGSPLYRKGKVNARNRIAHYKNIAIWLVKDGQSPWHWVIPDSAKVSQKKGITFVECDQTWLAIRPLATSIFTRDNALTQHILTGKKARFVDHHVLAARGKGTRYCGMIVELGDKHSHRSVAQFQRQILEGKVDESKLQQGIVQYFAKDGKGFGFHWSDNAQDLGVWRNGKRHDWKKHSRYLHRPGQEEKLAGPIFSKWGQGTLYVEAGGKAFFSRVGDDGKVTFAEGTPQDIRAKMPEQ